MQHWLKSFGALPTLGELLPKVVVVVVLSAPSPFAQTNGNLLFPVDCELGDTCVIQQYVDRDPGPGSADFTCGPLTYDGHRGTDIRLADQAAMWRGVDVLSASPGEVVGIRDGMPDYSQRGDGAPDVSGRECGNGVLIERVDGWQFQYCHLRRGSVAVAKGDRVLAGDRLGQIGLSGMTQFPHLHLLVRDQAGRVIDPFDARQQNESCRLRDRRSLWRDLSGDDYQPGGPLAAGFFDRAPNYDEVRQGTAQVSTLATDAPAIVFWAHFFGPREGDLISLSLRGPAGDVISTNTHEMTRNRATEFRAVGRRASGPWAPGLYKGQADLIRDGARIDGIAAEILVQ